MVEGKEQSKMLGELISRAWSDEAFRARLLSDTMPVLKENGIAVPEGVTVKAVENTDTVFHLVIPPSFQPVSDASLERLASEDVAILTRLCQDECDPGCVYSWDKSLP